VEADEYDYLVNLIIKPMHHHNPHDDEFNLRCHKVEDDEYDYLNEVRLHY
jgi:hypothetical protein